MKTTVDIESLIHCWEPLENLFHIRTRDEYENAVKILNTLLDRVMDNQSHPLFGFVETLGAVIEAWEKPMTRKEGGSKYAFGPSV
ncbi:MAG: hypothetical protein ACYCVG_04480 [Leptospirillum sp.]